MRSQTEDLGVRRGKFGGVPMGLVDPHERLSRNEDFLLERPTRIKPENQMGCNTSREKASERDSHPRRAIWNLGVS